MTLKYNFLREMLHCIDLKYCLLIYIYPVSFYGKCRNKKALSVKGRTTLLDFYFCLYKRFKVFILI